MNMIDPFMGQYYTDDMIVEELVYAKLFIRGLSGPQVDAIIARAKVDLRVMSRRQADIWGYEVPDLPGWTFAKMWVAIEVIALEYIDENIPDAWFRGRFEAL